MIFPEWLYQLLPGDVGSQQLEIVYAEQDFDAAAVTVGGHVYVVPPDKVLVLQNVVMEADAGGALISTRRRIQVDPAPGVASVRYDLTDSRNDVGAGGTTLIWTGTAFVPGGWSVRIEGDFSAATSSNHVGGELHGVLIPRGTFIW